MSKTKGSKTAATKTSEPTPGGLVFEKLGKDFEIPTIAKTSMFEEGLKAVKAAPGEAFILYKAPYANARKVYAKCKAVKTQAKVMDIKNFNAVVRRKGDDAVLICGAGLGEETAEE